MTVHKPTLAELRELRDAVDRLREDIQLAWGDADDALDLADDLADRAVRKREARK